MSFAMPVTSISSWDACQRDRTRWRRRLLLRLEWTRALTRHSWSVPKDGWLILSGQTGLFALESVRLADPGSQTVLQRAGEAGTGGRPPDRDAPWSSTTSS